MTATLVLGWGNPGRRDDGLGPACVERLRLARLPGIEVEVGYQLQIEDAARVAAFPRVIFVDADRAAVPPFRCQRLQPESAARGVGFSSHSLTPGALLSLARSLFGVQPEAWLLGIRGYDFDDFGEGLSAPASENLEAALRFLDRSLRRDRFAPEPDRPDSVPDNPTHRGS